MLILNGIFIFSKQAKAMTSYRERRIIIFNDCDDDVIMDERCKPPNQQACNHFMHSPSGLRNMDGLSQAYEQTYGIYRIGTCLYSRG